MIRPRTIDSGGARCRRPAFTLIELVVVAGIITLLLAMTLPALSSMWSQRKEADVQNTLRGVLSSARVQAKSGGERGLFFCLIDGVQKVFPIVRDPFDPATDPPGLTDKDTLDRFLVVEGDVHTFPDPLRVVPRYVVDNTGNSWELWSTNELINEDYRVPGIQLGHDPQVHRNFFSMIFSADGRLMPSRNVLIHDPDVLPVNSPDGFGDRTGLAVNAITQYFDETGTAIPLPGPSLADIVVDTNNDGINFIGVDGILVYDESLFRDLVPVDGNGALREDLLIRTGQPMYVSRVTGEIIMGPTSENEAPPP